ncbi:MAG: acyl-CoA dehydrogenase family protein [Thermoleophilia bacterium]|nr:acyl-CoA dehydrogenase family protein [Thermoleophilia bacterium]
MTIAQHTSAGSLREMAPRIGGHPLLRGKRLAEFEQLLMATRQFAVNSIRPRALELDEIARENPGNFAWDLVREGGRLGLLNAITPRVAGGASDQACLRASLISEELAAGCAGMATLFGAHSLGASPLVFAGPAHWDGAIKEAAKSASDPRPQIMAFCITEPTAGTDVEHHLWMRSAQIVTRADKTAGGWLLTGTKHFISNGNVATWLTVFMPTDPKRPYETLTAFLVDGRSKGLTVTNVEHKMGHRASPAAELSFDNVFVSDENVIGLPGDGMAMTIAVLAGSRPAVGAIATGIARGAYERLVDWLRNDEAAAGLLDKQQVQLALARMYEAIHLARQAYIDAATDFDVDSVGNLAGSAAMRAYSGLPTAMRTNSIVRRQMNSPLGRRMLMEMMARKVGNRKLTRTLGLSSLAKARGSDTAVFVTGLALEIAGLDCGALRPELEKCVRDAKLTQIYEGTNQLNRLEVFDGLVAEHSMSLLPRPVVTSENGVAAAA